MARVKHYNSDTKQWEYSDTAFGSSQNPGTGEWTDADKAAFFADVIDAIKVEYPDAHVIYGDVDSDNNIIISGALADGTYILKYENADGTVIEIGSLELGGIENLTEEQLAEMLTFANAGASMITTRRGALKVMPKKEEILNLMNK